MQQLQKKLNYNFRDLELLSTALTHSSYANEHHCQSNERLEFLGDSVLGMVVAEYLYTTYPELPEGRMTRLRAELVCETSLWTVADALGFGTLLRLGKGEEITGGRSRHSMLADCVEAVIAAMYLDGGIGVARAFIMKEILDRFDEQRLRQTHDCKTELQEFIQQKPSQMLCYELVDSSGPDHKKVFVSAVILNGREAGRGEGFTKKEAEQNAARSALEHLMQL